MIDSTIYRSPFAGHAHGAQPRAGGAIGVTVDAQMLGSVTLVSTWNTGIANLSTALEVGLGHPLPRATGDVVGGQDGLVMRTGPEEFMLVGDHGTDAVAKLRAIVGPETGSVTDLSHARCRIRVSGSHSVQTLSKLFPIDFRDAAFPLGKIRLTGHHHVPCTLHRTGAQAFDLYVFTTYACDQLEVVLDAAMEFGVSLGTVH